MRYVWILVLLTLFVGAKGYRAGDSVDRLIANALHVHPSLAALRAKLDAADAKIAQSGLWENPMLSFSITDIRIDNPLRRTLEPMQTHTLSLKQRIPLPETLESKTAIERSKKTALVATLDGAKLRLAESIRITVASIAETDALIALLRRYQKLLQKNRALYNDYMQLAADAQMQSLSASLMIKRFQSKIEMLRGKRRSQMALLRYLSAQKSLRLHPKLRLSRLKRLRYYLARLHRSPRLQKSDAELAQGRAVLHLRTLQRRPDPYLSISYANRFYYRDYLSIGVGVSLPIYGREERRIEEAKALLLAKQEHYSDTEAKLRSEIVETYRLLQGYRRELRVLRDANAKQITAMHRLSLDAIESGEDLISYTKVLQEALDIERETIAVKAAYMKAFAKLHTLTGEI